MTDYTKLIEEACSTAAKYELENYYGTSKDYTAMCKVEAGEAQRALQSAIQALQGEVERERKNRQAAQIENEALKTRLAAAPKAPAPEPLTDEQAIEAMWKARSKWMEEAGIDTAGIQHDVPTLYAMLPYFRAGEAAHRIGGTP